MPSTSPPHPASPHHATAPATAGSSGPRDHQPVIGIPQLTAYYLSNLIGAGIFVLPALAQEAAGSWTLVAWLLMAICSGPAAWVMGRICIDFPNRNGILAFVGHSVSKRAEAALSRLIVLTMIVGTPVAGLIIARYAIAAFNLPPGVLYPLGWFVMLLTLGFNLMKLRNSSRAQTVLVAIAMLVLIALAASSIGMADRMVPDESPFSATGLMAAIGICFYAFLGWENVATIAPDVKRPERTFPIALAISVPLVSLIYLVVALGLLLASQAHGGLQGNLAVLDHLMQRVNQPALGLFANLLAIVVVFLSANAWMLSAARLLASSVRDGHFPGWMADRYGFVNLRTMSRMALFHAIIFLLMYLFDGAEQTVVPLVSASFLLIYLITLAGAIRHYRHGPTRWLAVAALLMIAAFALSIWRESLIVLSLFALFLLRSSAGSRHSSSPSL